MLWQPVVDNALDSRLNRKYDSVDDFPAIYPPIYFFYKEALKVVDRLNETSGNPIKKQMIAFYDDKLLALNSVETFVVLPTS